MYIIVAAVLTLFWVGDLLYADVEPNTGEGNQGGILEITPQVDGAVNTVTDTTGTGGDSSITTGATGSGNTGGGVQSGGVQPTTFTGILSDSSSASGQFRDYNRTADPLTVAGLLRRLQGVLNAAIPFIIGLTIFVIIWGIFTYVTQAANEEKRTEARQFILYGIIGLFLMLSIWGFVNILIQTFDLNRQINTDDIPTVPVIL